MADDAGMRYFTVEEARALVPRLRGLLTALQVEKRNVTEEVAALQRLTPAMRADGYAGQAIRHEMRIDRLVAAMRDKLNQIQKMGVEVKDLDVGLVDFPSLREGRVVYLCWRVDEPTVDYWHELDAGYRGRQPLDG